MKRLRWTARITALLIFIFGLMFHFGYGNPLPFVNQDYTVWDNTALTLALFIFLGLAAGWKYERIGGYMILISLLAGFLLRLIANTAFSVNMIIAVIPGLLYLVVGEKK